MTATLVAHPRIASVEREIDLARQRGPLQRIVVPPCPELLVRLQHAMAAAEPDLNEVGRIAGADVAMAATLIRNANGAAFAVGPPVATAGQAMNRIGLRQSAAIGPRWSRVCGRGPAASQRPSHCCAASARAARASVQPVRAARHASHCR